jgi:hypothetical protein
LVTLGIGGNDVGFPSIMRDCIVETYRDFFDWAGESSCEKQLGDSLQTKFDALVSGNILGETYKEVRRRAPFARVVIVGYPRFFVEGGAGSAASDNHCAVIRLADQRWINHNIRKLNTLIANQAAGLGMQYGDIYTAPDGHEQCGPSEQLFLNGLIGFGDSESYHPTAFGHELIAARLASSLTTPDPGTYFNVLPGQTIATTFQSSGEPLSLSTQWPGSDVELTLTSPSGRVIDRSVNGGDVQHELGPTFESYHLSASEPGTWTATLFGAQVAPQGEPTRLSIWHVPPVNQDPIARLSLSQDGRTVTVDAGASTDSDGNIIDYLWEFGDGTTATGSTASHTYTTAGKYLTTLAIRDNTGGEAFTSAEHSVTISSYDFTGFFQPVAAAPAISEVKAGRALPMKFTLGGDYGLSVIQAGSPTSVQVACPVNTPVSPVEPTSTAGAGTLTYDAATQRYNYVWKTQDSWAGTCRTFNMTLNDGSSHNAMFKFVR